MRPWPLTPDFELDMFLWNMDAPDRNKVNMLQNL